MAEAPPQQGKPAPSTPDSIDKVEVKVEVKKEPENKAGVVAAFEVT